VAYGLEGLVAVSASAGRIARAGRLLGAAERLREESGLYNAPAFSFHQRLVEGIEAGPAAEEFAAARAEGRLLSIGEAIGEALGEAVA
jgi:hypothetical protein